MSVRFDIYKIDVTIAELRRNFETETIFLTKVFFSEKTVLSNRVNIFLFYVWHKYPKLQCARFSRSVVPRVVCEFAALRSCSAALINYTSAIITLTKFSGNEAWHVLKHTCHIVGTCQLDVPGNIPACGFVAAIWRVRRNARARENQERNAYSMRVDRRHNGRNVGAVNTRCSLSATAYVCVNRRFLTSFVDVLTNNKCCHLLNKYISLLFIYY